nr:MAG TPA: dissimilatory sulfite reductase D [Caudoviricetes sp.]DAN29255.1 MAG TPA: dissimilatory sulfite reductase D [Caudoviricetes sp.]
MLENNIVDYMIRECKANYNLDGAKLIKKSVEDKKVQFVFKRSDLKLSAEFQNDKISNIIYNNFLSDNQRENVTEQEFTERMSEMLEITDIENMQQIDEIAKKIIKDINSSKLFGGTVKELLLNSEDREKLLKIKRFFGAEKQLLKLYEEIEELHEAHGSWRKSFYKDNSNMIEEIADCFVIALQINKTKMIRNLIKGLVDNSNIFKTEMIEKIIKMVKFKINRTVDRIEKGEYGTYRIEYKADRLKKQPDTEKKEEQTIKDTSDVFEAAENKNLKKLEKEKLKKESKILKFIEENQPYYYQARDIQLKTNIKSKECTEIVTELIKAGKITVTKDGKQGIYGATIELSNNIEDAEVVS